MFLNLKECNELKEEFVENKYKSKKKKIMNKVPSIKNIKESDFDFMDNPILNSLSPREKNGSCPEDKNVKKTSRSKSISLSPRFNVSELDAKRLRKKLTPRSRRRNRRNSDNNILAETEQIVSSEFVVKPSLSELFPEVPSQTLKVLLVRYNYEDQLVINYLTKKGWIKNEIASVKHNIHFVTKHYVGHYGPELFSFLDDKKVGSFLTFYSTVAFNSNEVIRKKSTKVKMYYTNVENKIKKIEEGFNEYTNTKFRANNYFLMMKTDLGILTVPMYSNKQTPKVSIMTYIEYNLLYPIDRDECIRPVICLHCNRGTDCLISSNHNNNSNNENISSSSSSSSSSSPNMIKRTTSSLNSLSSASSSSSSNQSIKRTKSPLSRTSSFYSSSSSSISPKKSTGRSISPLSRSTSSSSLSRINTPFKIKSKLHKIVTLDEGFPLFIPGNKSSCIFKDKVFII
eukprot:TRINITY_DN9189_c0_g1_i1.p1 TRINITY_DN9189_c0_g1~~TRINITY_DN9189_c0_g1_i1.p1  ORF type:complete len:456 (+),score=77.25 TRINITY_DN9189_c0_g1_i1:161-1528(+)